MLLFAGSVLCAQERLVVDFEGVTVLLAPNDKANRVEQWEDKGVVFRPAHAPKKTKAKGLVMFFEHLSNRHKGIGSAMALEEVPVRATLPKPASEVAVTFWGSTGVPAVLEAFDADGKVVDRAAVAAAPGRKAPGDPVPMFTLTVKGSKIAYVQFSGPRPGEYLAAEEVRVTLAAGN
ncbi:hypothetical protein F183_A47620 [Bryobacterales bacterium F-183]|nr:hypothetical protein F183_A47620 [Bryobacterales bacterium F-183]